MTFYVLLSFLGFASLLPVFGIFCFFLIGFIQQRRQSNPSMSTEIEMELVFRKQGLSPLKPKESLLTPE